MSSFILGVKAAKGGTSTGFKKEKKLKLFKGLCLLHLAFLFCLWQDPRIT